MFTKILILWSQDYYLEQQLAFQWIYRYLLSLSNLMLWQLTRYSFINLPVVVDALGGGRIVWMSLSKLPTRESYNEHNKTD